MQRLSIHMCLLAVVLVWASGCAGEEATGDTTDPTTAEDTSSDDADSAEPGDVGDDPADTLDDPSDDPSDDTPVEPEPEDIGDPCETDADCSDPLFCEDLKCVAGRGEECSPTIGCAAGHDCVSTAAGASCLEICEDTSACRALERCWADGEGSLLGELGGYCFANLCGPPDNFGILKPAEFMGVCDAAGTGDGICFGPISETQLGPIGVCMNITGELAAGSSCDPAASNAEQSGLCSDGLCSPANVCATFCDVQENACEPWPDGTETSCEVASEVADANNGLCSPEAPPEEETEGDAPTDSGEGEG